MRQSLWDSILLEKVDLSLIHMLMKQPQVGRAHGIHPDVIRASDRAMLMFSSPWDVVLH